LAAEKGDADTGGPRLYESGRKKGVSTPPKKWSSKEKSYAGERVYELIQKRLQRGLHDCSNGGLHNDSSWRKSITEGGGDACPTHPWKIVEYDHEFNAGERPFRYKLRRTKMQDGAVRGREKGPHPI